MRFKLGNNSEYALQETDRRLVNFLKTRNLHFRALLEHLSGLYFISAIAGGLLLGLGGYLVINNQLSLGQLVAAEIVLGALSYAFDQISALLSDRVVALKFDQPAVGWALAQQDGY